MHTVAVELTDEQRARLETRAHRRGIDDVEVYVQTLVAQFVAQIDDEDGRLDDEVASTLESLGYL